jgi:hypothetical protein
MEGMKRGDPRAGALELRAKRSIEAKPPEPVVEQADAETTTGTLAEQLGEAATGLVAAKDVGLEEDLLLGRCDGVGHRPEGTLATREDLDGVSGREDQH